MDMSDLLIGVPRSSAADLALAVKSVLRLTASKIEASTFCTHILTSRRLGQSAYSNRVHIAKTSSS